MKRLITTRRWKHHLRNRQRDELARSRRIGGFYRPPREKAGFFTIKVPDQFSIIRNPDQVIAFLRRIRLLAKKYNISLELRDVNEITPEAIAALTATIAPLRDTIIRGDYPENGSARRALVESGFFEYVRNTQPLPKGQLGKIKERKSKQVESPTARELIECGTLQAFGKPGKSLATRAAYTALIEAMGNTHNHASGDESKVETWWATSFGDTARRRVCYSFVDTGVGIFKSVKVSKIRRALRQLGIRDDPQLLQDILQGRVQSSTGLPYRGKGLPTIYQRAKSGALRSLYIIANDVFADVSNGVYRSLSESFAGTLLYWECEE